MRISYRSLPKIWLTILLVFAAFSAAWFGYLWINSGGKVPGLTNPGYRVSFAAKDVDNLGYFNDVRMAGVKVGKVVKVVNAPRQATLTIELDPRVVPLHEGVTVRVGAKSLVEESYVDVQDGHGAPVPSGIELPESAVTPSVQLDQVLNSFDPATRAALSSTLHSLAKATGGRGHEVDQLFDGFGGVGRGGRTTLEALAEQSTQLKSLSADTATLLNALDTQRGQIAQLVDSGERIMSATSDGRADLEATMRQLPSVLDATETASDKLDVLGGALAPVSRDLNAASPALTSALRRLPSTSAELRGMLPPLDETLGEAPATLDRVSTFRSVTDELITPGVEILRDVDPMLAYIEPYGHDIAGMFTNFGAHASQGNAAGNWSRSTLVFSEQSLKAMPKSTNVGPLNRSNAYQAPMGALDPKPFTGTYPRIERDGG
jgi:phospholipid/cholesterol/gamma-HCH transport system substrate-binding protein